MPKKKRKKQNKTEFDIVHMTASQVEEIKHDINGLEKMLDDTRPWVKDKITDKSEVRKQISDKKQIIADHAPKMLRGEKANKAYAEANRLKAFIAERMPDSRSYFQPYRKDADNHNKQADFEKTVQQQMVFQTNPEIQRAVIRYKNIMRRLDPSDPTNTNIEALRK